MSVTLALEVAAAEGGPAKGGSLRWLWIRIPTAALLTFRTAKTVRSNKKHRRDKELL